MGASPSTLRELIVAGNLQALKNAVQEHGEQTINYALDASDTTPLLLASRQFRPKIVAWLCENGADLTRQDDRGWTPLHWASSAGDVGAAAVLLDRGADSSRRDIVGRLPRHLLELAVCDASTDEIHERLVESELQPIGDATHSLAVPAASNSNTISTVVVHTRKCVPSTVGGIIFQSGTVATSAPPWLAKIITAVL